MFFIFIILSLIIALAAGIYICLCTRRLLEFYGADIKKKWVKAANIIISIVLAGLCMPLFTNTAVIILHLVASFLFFDIYCLSVSFHIFFGQYMERDRKAINTTHAGKYTSVAYCLYLWFL